MRHFVLRWARSFGTQSDKDFFFHNLAKTGEVARPQRRVVATLLLICSLAAAASVVVARPHALVVKCADTRRHRRAIRPRPTPSARRSLPSPSPSPPLLLSGAELPPGIDPLSRHHQNRARDDPQRQRCGACSSVQQRALAPTPCSDGIPWSLKLISNARAEIEDARALRDSEVQNGTERNDAAAPPSPRCNPNPYSVALLPAFRPSPAAFAPADDCAAAHHGARRPRQDPR